MNKIPYDASKTSLFEPGAASNFFQLSDEVHQIDCLCAEMSRLAYVKDEQHLIDYLARANYFLQKTWGYGSTGTQIFIARSADDERMVIAFRGTEPDDPSDIASDADLRKTGWYDINQALIGNVHQGFADALLRDVNNGDILADLSLYIQSETTKCTQLLLTGHSLGAALATLAAAYFSQSQVKEKISLVTLGSPLIGDAEFAEHCKSIPHQRFVNCCDLVTRIPPPILGFRHTGDLHYLDRNGRHLENSVDDAAIAQDRRIAAAIYIEQYSFRKGMVALRDLADHSPVNYLSGICGLRDS